MGPTKSLTALVPGTEQGCHGSIMKILTNLEACIWHFEMAQTEGLTVANEGL